MSLFKTIFCLFTIIHTISAKTIACKTDNIQLLNLCGCQKIDGEYQMQWNKNIYLNETLACECSQVLELDNLINYWDIHYCQSRKIFPYKWKIIMIFLWLPVISYLFTLIASTADLFFVPTLEDLSDVMNLSPSVSGATLLALANGAPDFFCSIAGMSGTPQPDIIVGGLIGSAIVTSGFIFGIVIFVAPYQSRRRLFLRDALFLLFTIILFGVAIHANTIHLWAGCLMFAAYVIYVLIVIFSKKIVKKLPKLKDIMTTTHLFSPKYRRKSLILNHKDRVDSVSTQIEAKSKHNGDIRELDITSDEDSDNNTEKTDMQESTVTAHAGEKSTQAKNNIIINNDVDDISIVQVSFIGEVRKYIKYVTQWDEQTSFGIFITVLESPLTLLRILSIPILPSEGNSNVYHRSIIAIQIMFSLPLIVFSFVKSFLLPPTILAHVSLYGISVFLAIISFFYFLPSNEPPTKKWITIFILFLSMCCCSSWIMMIANELLALLDVIGIGIGMTECTAGYTFLAWGNSLPDLMVNVAAAKNGECQAAITSCFAGTIFNVLCSFGCAVVFSGIDGMIINAGFKYTITYLFIVIGLLFIIIKTVHSKYYMGKLTGSISIVWYMVFLTYIIYEGFSSKEE